MPGTCQRCDERVIERDGGKFGSKYAGICADCLADHDEPRHVDTCDRDSCPVCDDYRREFGLV